MAKTNFKVVIAGGSIAGLSLALMLEQQGIDFILLEAYGNIAPNVGASFGALPNGLRIMDQLGCFEPINDLRIPPFEPQEVMDSKGRRLSTAYGLPEHFEKRFGYPSCFIDRQQLIQILYDKLQHKHRVLLNKRVDRVEMSEDDVTVTTKDGDTFKGDLIVGADGVHSSVRQNMWRVANEIEPGTFDENEINEVPCYLKCLFGISKSGTFPEGFSNAHVLANKSTMLLMEGPEKRAYFFLWVPLPNGPVYGKDIPRFTKEDEAELVKEQWDAPIVEGKLTFGDMYKARLSSTLVPLQEYVFKKWFYGRMITIGDSAHKQDPLGGQGGNGAMESAAALTNALTKMLREHPDRPSTEDIDSALAEAQDARHANAVEVGNSAHKVQAMMWKLNSPFGHRVVKLMAKIMDPAMAFNEFSRTVEVGLKLEGIRVPFRPRAFPFNDELPSKPGRSALAFWIPAILAAILLVLLALLRTTTSTPSITMANGSLTKCADERLLANATGGLPAGISALLLPMSQATAFGAMQSMSSFAGGQYLVALFAPILTVWFVESQRIGNKLSPISLMGVFGGMSLLFGITRVVPFYYILSIFTASNDMFGRRVPDAIVQSMIPTIVIGYAILDRTVPLLSNASAWIYFKGLWWVLVPAYFLSLGKVIQLSIKSIKVSRSGKPKEDFKTARGKAELESYAITDASPLRKNFAATFALSALVHISLVGRHAYRSGLDLSKALRTAPVSQDIIFHSLVLTVYLLYTVWDMRRMGYITTVEAVKAAAAVTAGQLLVGPGATYAGTWYWREGVLTRRYRAPKRAPNRRPVRKHHTREV